MELTLLALAVAPGIAIAIYVFWRDKHEKEPLRLVLWSFLLGVLSTIPAAIIVTLLSPEVPVREGSLEYAFTNATLAGLIEELCKFAVILFFVYPRKDFNEPYDGITYCVMSAMGFATFENILYVYQGGVQVAVIRMFTAVPAHASFGILMGYFMGLSKFRPGPKQLLAAALLVPALFHFAYDFFLMANLYQLFWIGGLGALVVGVWVSLRAIKQHQQLSPFNGNQPEA